METFSARVKALPVLLGVWLLLSYPLTLQEVITGAAASLLLVLLPLPEIRIYREIGLAPKRIVWLLLYVLLLVKEIFKANIDVALRVVRPVLPIRPGIVMVKTRLKSGLGRLVLANSITLTPGTITVEARGEDFYIHWISVDADDPDEATRRIVAQFEKVLEVVFG